MKPKPDKGHQAGDPLNLRIDPDLKRRFRIACAVKGVAMTDVVVKAIEHFVTSSEGRTPSPTPHRPRRGGGNG